MNNPGEVEGRCNRCHFPPILCSRISLAKVLCFLSIMILAGCDNYQIYAINESHLIISPSRSPNENSDLIDKYCSISIAEYCECVLDNIYKSTSRVDRVIFLYISNYRANFFCKLIWRCNIQEKYCMESKENWSECRRH